MYAAAGGGVTTPGPAGACETYKRVMRIWFAAVLAATAAGAAPSLPPPVLALAGGTLDRPSRLVALDPATLELRARGPALPGWAFGLIYARSPDRSRAAILPRPSDTADHVFLVDTRRLRVVGRAALGRTACAASWPDPDRIVLVTCYGLKPSKVFSRKTEDYSLEELVLDADSVRIVARRQIAASVSILATAATGDGLALLVGPRTGAAPARLALASVDGVTVLPLPGERVRARAEGRALAIDAAGSHAFVVNPDFSVTEVDIATGAVSRHPAAVVRRPAAVAKGPGPGPVVEAVWAGNGMLAVAGGSLRRDGTFVPAGARLIDTRTWRSRLLDPGAASVTAGGGLVLTCQGRYDQRSEQAHGSGVLVFANTGSLRYRALPGERVAGVRVDGRHAYVQRALGFGEAFDLRTGRRTAYAINGGLAASLILGDGGP
jgi:hypothetical protein